MDNSPLLPNNDSLITLGDQDGSNPGAQTARKRSLMQ
mgnify:CR=1 FL=1